MFKLIHGSFNSMKEAEKEAVIIRRSFPDDDSIEADRNDVCCFVRLGEFKDRKSAEECLSKFYRKIICGILSC